MHTSILKLTARNCNLGKLNVRNSIFKCQDLAVDKWKEVEVNDDETRDIKLEDIFD